MDTNDLIVRSWQHTFRALTGADGPIDEILRSFGEPLTDTIGRFFPDRDRDEVVRVYRDFHVDIFEDAIRPFPGIREMLEALKSEGYTLGLVTSRLARTTRRGLKKFDLSHYFDSIVTEEDTERSKPDPAPILLSLDRLGKAPGEAIMIGDTLHDIGCARNAGVPVALVSWTLAAPESRRTGDNAPDFILETPESLIGLLRSYNAAV
jgi:pyrophosphatase PpaX